MNHRDNINVLKTLTCDRLSDTLRQIRSHREHHNPTNEGRFCIPEYLLDEALPYLSGAWDLIVSDRPKPAVTLARWVVEASLNLYSVVNRPKEEIDDSLRVLLGEALRNEPNLYKGLMELWPDEAELFSRRANMAREVRNDDLGLNGKLQSLESRLREVKLPSGLYPIYRICCAAAHPSLNVWERFGADDSTGLGSPIDIHTACWMAAQSTLHLVAGSYILTELETGDKEALQSWWTDNIGPRLNSVA